jgi:hypothetical protein
VQVHPWYGWQEKAANHGGAQVRREEINSKIKYMKGATPVAAAPQAAGKSWRQPSPVMPSDTDDSDEPEVAVSS